jgi:hypothetical protein
VPAQIQQRKDQMRIKCGADLSKQRLKVFVRLSIDEGVS